MGNRFKEKEKDTKKTLVSESTENTLHNENNTINNTQPTIYKIEEKPKEEIRNKRIQIVVKPSLKDKLDYLVEHGYIKSVNDFANFLFERGIVELETAHGFKAK